MAKIGKPDWDLIQLRAIKFVNRGKDGILWDCIKNW
jgi:hypothetical protein